MRVVIVAECFLPEINGVTNSVLRAVEHLERRHHEVLVIAPGIGRTQYSHTPVVRVPAVELPFYRGLSVGLPTRHLPHAIFVGCKTGGELSALVASFDVFVHTGFNETFCQAIQEALASGVPVVAPAAGGPLDTVRHGHNGYLYPPDHPVLLAEAVGELARDPELRAVMGRRACESVKGRDWESLGDQLLGYYRRVMERPERVRAAA